MPRLRSFLHPIHSARSLYRVGSMYVNKCLAARQFRDIRRGQRDRCWCDGELLPFKWHQSYGVCAKCGCYVNRHPPLPEELKRLYSFDLYWHTRQQLKGHPAIEGRPASDRSDGRLEYWLELVGRYGPSSGCVVEVGCGHGVLLAELKARGYECIGVEPDELTAEWTRQNMELDIRSGFFPGVDLVQCDLFLAFDVIEHSPYPDKFMRQAAQLLVSEGVAIIQTPIEYRPCEPPFGEMHNQVFDDLEHLFVFTRKSIEALAESSGLSLLAEDEWHLAHEIVVLRPK